MDWEGAARKDRVRAQGAEPADRQRVSAARCEHRWSPWQRAGALDPRWRRDCAKCGRIQVRDKPTKAAAAQPAKKRREPVARTKGDLVVRRADGTVEQVPARDATQAARQTMPKRRPAR